ncbi:hypothetical protein, partial [Oceanobacillus sp. ISL-73]|uniref:hypothetical protein n=1 Tax=Oceanobacillus sp. ISL-73 TaxID=2819161 RepID=UPI001BEC70FD
MRDLFVITGMIDDIKVKALKLEKELLKNADDNDIYFEELEEIALDINDTSDNLISELDVD